jgi:hypothetical protein
MTLVERTQVEQVFCALVQELCELMSARYGLRGLKIAVLAISLLCAAYQTWDSLPT